MTSEKFVKTILKEVSAVMSNNDVNREFKEVNQLDAVRIDMYYSDLDAVIQDKPSIRTTFNGLLDNKTEKLNTIKHLEKYLKMLKSKVKEEEE